MFLEAVLFAKPAGGPGGGSLKLVVFPLELEEFFLGFDQLLLAGVDEENGAFAQVELFQFGAQQALVIADGRTE